jgi:hypothetical protein
MENAVGPLPVKKDCNKSDARLSPGRWAITFHLYGRAGGTGAVRNPFSR